MISCNADIAMCIGLPSYEGSGLKSTIATAQENVMMSPLV